MRSPRNPPEAEGKRDVPFLSEIKRPVCGPGRALNAMFLASRSLGSATALARKEKPPAGWLFLCHWPENKIDLAFPPANFHRWEQSHAPGQRLNTSAPQWMMLAVFFYGGVSLDLGVNGLCSLLSASDQFFSRGDSAPRELHVGSP